MELFRIHLKNELFTTMFQFIEITRVHDRHKMTISITNIISIAAIAVYLFYI